MQADEQQRAVQGDGRRQALQGGRGAGGRRQRGSRGVEHRRRGADRRRGKANRHGAGRPTGVVACYAMAGWLLEVSIWKSTSMSG